MKSDQFYAIMAAIFIARALPDWISWFVGLALVYLAVRNAQ